MESQKIASPENEILLVEKNAGVQAIEEIIDKHLLQIMEIRKKHALENRDLLSIEIKGNRAIEPEVRKDISRFQEKIKIIVEAVSERIANRQYRLTEQAIKGMKLAKNERETFAAVLRNDKKVYISCQSLKFAIDVFMKLNNHIIERLKQNGELTDNTQPARRMILAIAITVYELLDFVINYLEAFKVAGIEELHTLYQEICDMNHKLLAKENEREQQALTEEIQPEVKEKILHDVQNRRTVLSQLSSEWKTYIKTIERLKEQIELVSERLPFLRLTRESAKGQIEILQVASVLALTKTNLDAIQSSLESLEKINPVPLSPEKTHKLFGNP